MRGVRNAMRNEGGSGGAEGWVVRAGGGGRGGEEGGRGGWGRGGGGGGGFGGGGGGGLGRGRSLPQQDEPQPNMRSTGKKEDGVDNRIGAFWTSFLLGKPPIKTTSPD